MSVSEIESPPVSLAEPFIQLGKDIKQASASLNAADARWLIDMYFTVQEDRKRAAAQERTSSETGEPRRLIGWVYDSMQRFELAIKSSLGHFAGTYAVGQWIQSLHGFGPVLSAAMLAFFDVRDRPTVGHFWRFAGLDPTSKWEKGKKRPWNARLKSICTFRMGETLVKHSGSPKCVYGQLYAMKKVELTKKNEQRDFADQAKAEIARCEANANLLKKMKKTERWKYWQDGRLCPQHVHDRARRWMVKLFLSHLHYVEYQHYYGKVPPAPYIFEHPGDGRHTHLIEPPNWPGDFDGRHLRHLLEDGKE